MELTDKEYFELIKNLFDILPSLFNSDAGFVLTDTEQFISVRQANSFDTNTKEGQALQKDGMAQQVIRTKIRQQTHYPKEMFGFSIISNCAPIINKSTGNVLGTLICSVSQQKENDVMEMAHDLQSFAEQLSASAQEMAGSAEELASSSHSIGELANKASEGINKMDDILNYITQISNTTNMLGLNAAIEAARAGEHGKGFTVVSKEIRNLATQSKTSVLDIAESLKTTKNDINNILEFINSFTSTSETQSAQAEELSASSESINELFTKLLKVAENLNKC